jgi:hypothetical protein
MLEVRQTTQRTWDASSEVIIWEINSFQMHYLA